MNTPKIAALYASPIFNTLLRFPDFDSTTTLTVQVMEHVMREARATSEDGRRYQVEASYINRRECYTYKDDTGSRTGGFLSENISKRAADWLLSQIPGWPAESVARLQKDVPEQDVLVVSVMGYGRRGKNPENDIETRAGMCFAGQEDLETLLRGIASICRKRRKQAKKLEAQLRTYHQQQLAATQAEQQRRLGKGVWLGAEKALTTTARIAAPDVPFMGDAPLTSEQQHALGMRFYAVDENTHGMPAAFPLGTGMGLRPVKRSRELVDGAVYFWRWRVNGEVVAQRLGRLDMSVKERGHLPLRDEAGNLPAYCWAAYGDSATEKGIELYRVTHYTTRSAEPVAPTMPLHQPQLRGQRQQRRELQAA